MCQSMSLFILTNYWHIYCCLSSISIAVVTIPAPLCAGYFCKCWFIWLLHGKQRVDFLVHWTLAQWILFLLLLQWEKGQKKIWLLRFLFSSLKGRGEKFWSLRRRIDGGLDNREREGRDCKDGEEELRREKGRLEMKGKGEWGRRMENWQKTMRPYATSNRNKTQPLWAASYGVGGEQGLLD